MPFSNRVGIVARVCLPPVRVAIREGALLHRGNRSDGPIVGQVPAEIGVSVCKNAGVIVRSMGNQEDDVQGARRWWLKEARLRAGLSRKQFGIQAGIDDFSASARINQYERGKHMPDLQTLTRLAGVLKVPVPYFYCEDSELAELVVKFAGLNKIQKKKLLGLIDGHVA
jgi:DNA-binding XRE family transcriptional regulator